MALILNIETSTPICSVNIARNGEIVAFRETDEDKSHASRLTVFINEMLAELKISVVDLDAVAISKGPGSYTGLRIGVSTAKGLCYGADKPLIAISTLQAMAKQVSESEFIKQKKLEVPLLCPMIDARRMEVYTAFYDLENVEQKTVSAEVIDETAFADTLENTPLVFFGNGAAKCKDSITHHNACFLEGIEASSTGMVHLSEKAFVEGQFEDVAYFEPFYLKDFIATVPKKNVLR